MAIGDGIQHSTARSALNEAEQLLHLGEYAQAIKRAFEIVEWVVNRIDNVQPIIPKTHGTSKTDALLQSCGLSHLSYSSGFPPVVTVLVAYDGTENIMVSSHIADPEIPRQVLARCMQIIAGIELHVGSLDAPYGKTIPPSA